MRASIFVGVPMVKHDVHLWYVHLAATDRFVDGCYRICSQDEQRRAHAFRFAKHRKHFIIGRGLLRIILGSYCQCHPKEINFRHAAKGKPFLLSPSTPGRTEPLFYFNVAHCEDRAILAFSQNYDMGVDIERIRDLDDALAIAKRFFSSLEWNELLSIDKSLRTEAFFNCWTRKEAYLKATGDGLSAPLNAVEVSLLPGEPSVLRRVNDRKAQQWSLLHLVPFPGFVGALAVPKPDCTLGCHRFESAEECLAFVQQRPHVRAGSKDSS